MYFIVKIGRKVTCNNVYIGWDSKQDIAYKVLKHSILRKSKNIPGSDCEDACVTVFCTPCSLAQVGRTLTNTDKICQ